MLLRLPRRKLRRLLIMLLPFLLTLLLLTPFYIIYKPPNLLIRYFQHRWPDVLFHLPPPPNHHASSTEGRQKLIALTIDDAPSPHTLEILDLLSHHDAHATFFLIGSQIPSREESLHELLRAGHELANHAMRDEPSRALSPSDLEAQILSVQDSIRAAYSVVGLREPAGKYFRPGSGFFSAAMRDVVRKLGFRIVLGSVYPHDAQIPWWWVNARHVLSMVREGSIIVCHDRREWTVPMLGVVLPELKRRGYRVVTVSELLNGVEGGEES
ncbi:putative polysaccharide deacetylase [Aspergillus steynii IBT 23096]|uniref:chitin deacetylase n=1 Tax=Aspergillus steynii IBT 23096 TaxID=1392250 RepID=A0A2I2G2Y2_9EURO|nr:putative polysaccharide deacetylase [Aspergillus steynii IBT 23096]PLB47236.1 putative polysaccharide deacetylase [Aspergillus steynii IBT 23096]